MAVKRRVQQHVSPTGKLVPRGTAPAAHPLPCRLSEAARDDDRRLGHRRTRSDAAARRRRARSEPVGRGAVDPAARRRRTRHTGRSDAEPEPGRSRDGRAGTGARRACEADEFKANANLNQIHFDFDKYNIRPGDAKILDANAAWLKSNAGNLVLIEGHCDDRGTAEYNLALGERRAKSTMNYLVAQGVQANRITIISYGKERPVCTEQTEACWAKNRRANFLTKAQ